MSSPAGPLATADADRAAGRLDAAVAGYRRLLLDAPGLDAALAGLFAALDALGRPGTPEEAVARSNRAEGLRRQGRIAEAEAEHRAALCWLPGFGGIHYNLGVVLHAQGRAGEAASAFQEAARLMPRFAGAPTNLAVALRDLGRQDEAATAARAALRLDPASVPAWLVLGAALRDAGHTDAAVAAFRAGAALAPGTAEVQANLGIALKEAGDTPASIPPLERAIMLGLADPGGVLAQLVQQRRHLCRWDGLEALSAALRALVRAGSTAQAQPWILLGEGLGPAVERAAAERYTAWRLRGVPPTAPPSPVPAEPGPIRVGYLSADFQEHATAVLLAEVIERHDRGRVVVHGYSYGAEDGGPMRRRLARAFDCFVDLRCAGHDAAAAVIRGDGIEILVDLKGHTQGARPEIPALRPAPVQVAWLGYPGTCGAPFLDYVLADAVVAPRAHQPYFTERIVHLPGCYQPNDRTRPVGATPSRAECGLPDDAVVLCCFNSPYKITPDLFAIWMGLLRRSPATVLWLLAGHPEATANLRRAAVAQGVDPARLVFAPKRPTPAYLAQYRAADLFLDTRPVGAHTTASDALWAGLPVLTMLGDSFAGRVAASLLHAVGLPDLVTETPEAYGTAALRLIGDAGWRTALRARLAAGRDTTPLFDTDRLARALESGFATMAARYRAGLPPEGFAIAG